VQRGRRKDKVDGRKVKRGGNPITPKGRRRVRLNETKRTFSNIQFTRVASSVETSVSDFYVYKYVRIDRGTLTGLRLIRRNGSYVVVM